MNRTLLVFAICCALPGMARAEVTCNDGTVGSGPEGCRAHGGVRNKGIRCRDGATSRRDAKDACSNHGGVGSPEATPPKEPNPAPQRNGDPDPRRDPIGGEP